jgi:hypothetical protein
MNFLDRWRGFRGRFERRLQRFVGRDRLVANVLIQEVDDEYLHIDYAFPLGAKILFVDLLDYGGRVYGAESIRQWTVLDRGTRHVLENPLFAFHAKREALRRLLGKDTESEGFLVFPENSVMGRDVPGNVVAVNVFFERLDGLRSQDPGGESLPARWDEIAARLKESRTE